MLYIHTHTYIYTHTHTHTHTHIYTHSESRRMHTNNMDGFNAVLDVLMRLRTTF